VTCLFSEDVLVRRRGTGEGAGLLFGLGSVLERTIRGRTEETAELVGWEFRAGTGGIGPSEGPGNLGANATMIRPGFLK
jgi:hypothetical protein